MNNTHNADEDGTEWWGIAFVAAVLCSAIAVAAYAWHYEKHPGPAPRTYSALMHNDAISAAFKTQGVMAQAGLHDLTCQPHGRNPGLGWTCTGHTLATPSNTVGSTVEEDVSPDGGTWPIRHLFTDLTDFYKEGLSFSADVNDGVKVSIDPNVATLKDVQDTVMLITQEAGAIYDLDNPEHAKQAAENNLRAANRNTWQR